MIQFICSDNGQRTVAFNVAAQSVNQATSSTNMCFPLKGDSLGASRMRNINRLAGRIHFASRLSFSTSRCPFSKVSFFVFDASH